MAAPFRVDPRGPHDNRAPIRVPTKSRHRDSVGWSSGVGAAAWAVQAVNTPRSRDRKPTFTRNRGSLRAVGEQEPMGAL